MKTKTQKILISVLLTMVIIDLVYIYVNTSSFNALYAGSTLILFGVAWDALSKLQSRNSGNS
jgi:capsule polysaccharide export protein KpsC/LpsZ